MAVLKGRGVRVLVLNSGSSSIKIRCLDVEGKPSPGIRSCTPVFRGAVRGIGGGETTLEWREGSDERRVSGSWPMEGHREAYDRIWAMLAGKGGGVPGAVGRYRIEAVGHRVVHGGERFSAPVIVDGDVESEIERLGELAPLHNPPCLAGIRSARAFFGDRVPMVAVFDTAFHRTLLPEARWYAIPRELAERHEIRRYGFHGIAHSSMAEEFATAVGKPLEELRLVTLQLGNGCSAAAVRYGASVDTSMGFTPLEGLVMGTRSGDIDPSVVAFLSEREGVSPRVVEDWLNHRSGLLGVSGRTNDMRELLAADREGDDRARLAVDMFCLRVRKYLGAYLAVLEGADAVLFGGGIGEGSPEVRERVCRGMEWCGLRLSPERNRSAAGVLPGKAVCISEDGSKPSVYAVGGDEETRIAIETVRCLRTADPSA